MMCVFHGLSVDASGPDFDVEFYKEAGEDQYLMFHHVDEQQYRSKPGNPPFERFQMQMTFKEMEYQGNLTMIKFGKTVRNRGTNLLLL